MIKTLLIANRGEIARRVMKTAQRMNIRCVAVYSEADSNAPHVREADEAVLIGPAPASESYLRADKIIEAAKQTGADAIHPGYGFLSENAEFAEACAANDIIFVGPSPDAIRAMGLKDKAKVLMEKAAVPVTPGYHGDNQDPEFLKSEAGQIGYPVLIKAVAGGGGKGMRKVDAESDFLASLESCQRESRKSFGNDLVLIEKFITNPRHIEVQVFGDSHGNVVHMYERDCSLQRRHQKVIEEAPAPGMTSGVREAMCNAAINAAKAVNYSGAGTVEFIVDGSGELREDGFYFMEMNTRLQVEHPVTEMVTGLDLVELQLRVADGGSVPDQDNISLTGHAIETRLYAEDPANGFLPSTGVLEEFGLPQGIEFELPSDLDEANFRIDASVDAGDEVSVFYDPMIAKLISFSRLGRDLAIDEMIDAIDQECFSHPVKTNAGFLRRALDHVDFRAAKIDTGFIEAHSDNLLSHETALLLKSLVAILQLSPPSGDSRDIWSAPSGFRLNASPVTTAHFELGDVPVAVQLNQTNNLTTAIIDDVSIEIEAPLINGDDYEGEIEFGYAGNHLVAVYSCPASSSGLIRISCRGEMLVFTPPDPEAHIADEEAGGTIKAPMPGKVLAVNVKAGDSVTKGDALIVLEAMKMEHALVAPRDGIIAELSVEAGAQVSDGDVLAVLAEEAAET